LRRGLAETGYVEGRNFAIEYRWASGQYDRLSGLAAELIHRRVSVMVAATTPGAAAAKQATATTPIIFTGVGGDPTKLGLVDSFNRPGANITGVYILSTALEPKKLELLHELLPKVTLIGCLYNPANPNAEAQVRGMQEAAHSLNLRLHVLEARNEGELATALAALVQVSAGALVVCSDPLFTSRRNLLVALALRHAMPAIYEFREFVVAGGLMSYGTSIVEAYRAAGVYAGRLLNGEKPGDLPVQQSSKLELVINLTTAKVLGLEIPPTLLARAGEVIE
jgi:putative tryptophan/tyrosine transport system substrate-binding protein